MKLYKSVVVAFLVILFVSPISFADEGAEAVALGGYKLDFPAVWQRVEVKRSLPELLFVRQFANRVVHTAGIMGESLVGDVIQEADEAISSAEAKEGRAELLVADPFMTADGVLGKRVVVKIVAQELNFGTPIIFDSIFLPKPDGGSVRFKLRCGEPQYQELSKEFQDIVFNGAMTP